MAAGEDTDFHESLHLSRNWREAKLDDSLCYCLSLSDVWQGRIILNCSIPAASESPLEGQWWFQLSNTFK